MVKYLFILFNFAFAVVTVGPDGPPTYHFATIQAAIDSVTTNPVDIEIDVYPGTYQENLLIEADMIIRSVGNANNTIIDGSLGRSLGSTIVIRPESMSTHHPLVEIDGFGITNGKGTDVINNTMPGNPEEKVGGGLFVYINSPKINNSQFLGNGDNSTDKGGAVFAASDSDDIGILERDHYEVHPDLEPVSGTLDFSYNTFQGNRADYGHSVYIEGFEESNTNLSSSDFDVFSTVYNSVSEYWVNSNSEINFSGAYSDVEAIYDSVWVDPVNGVDESNITGYEDNPFLTINYAMGMIYSTEENPITINLTEGTFAPSTSGEGYPINMISNVKLIGQGEEVTMLNAWSYGYPRRVLVLEEATNVIISNLTITGGRGNWVERGGGIYILNSNPVIANVKISGNEGDYGGGMYLFYSNPILINVTIANNTGDVGGGMYINVSNPFLLNVSIVNNFASEAGGIKVHMSNPTLRNVLISGNIGQIGGGAMEITDSAPILTNVTIANNTPGSTTDIFAGLNELSMINTIIWGNGFELVNIVSDDIITSTYGDIEGGWEGVGNIDADPRFVDTDNGDFILQDSSPCIDAGSLNIWYTDLDGSNADMGATGGLFILPNFTEYDFGEIGNIESTVDFTLYNYRHTPITIDSVSFSTSSFTTSTSFPMTIDTLETGAIAINCLPQDFGLIEDSMVIYSPDLENGISVSLSVVGSEGNLLSGDLFGELPNTTYRITGDLSVASGNTLTLLPGTEFLFDGAYNFTVEGILIAQGTEQDSIIFDNFEDIRWRGFTFNNITDATTLQYVRISGAEKVWGGGIYLFNSNPILINVTIANNTGDVGGGMQLTYSNPALTNVIIINNTANNGGGMYLNYSDPTLTNVTISENVANGGGGMYISGNSNPIMTDVTISENVANSNGGGMSIGGNPTLTDVTISENVANAWGGGVYITGDPTLTNVIIINNTANDGGGMYLHYSDPTLTNVTISGNTASGGVDGSEEGQCGLYYISCGGGMFIGSNSNPILTNVTISGNTAEEYGGGMHLLYSHPILTNVTIVNNTAIDEGGGMSLHMSTWDYPILTNTIIYYNSPQSIALYFGDEIPIITYSNIEGGWAGYGNISSNPLFTSPLLEDFTLQAGSPCIDSGTAFFIWEGDTLVNLNPDEYYGNAPDMGAFEFYEEPVYQPGDVTQDGSVNVTDIILLITFILMNDTPDSNEFALADLNTDSQLNVLDVVILVDMILGG